MIENLFKNIVLKYPKAILLSFFVLSLIMGYMSTKVSIDASSDTLLLDDDKDLAFTREINERYKTPNFLVVTFTPKKSLLSEESISCIQDLSRDFLKIDAVSSVISILNVPLLQSPPKPVKELLKNIPTLLDKDCNKTLAKKEFLTSPLYKRNLVSEDFKTTALILNLKDDKKYLEFIKTKKELKKRGDKAGLELLNKEFKRYKEYKREYDHKSIQQIRDTIKRYENRADMFLGGVNMIADDMISYIKSDLKIFGTILVLLLIGTLFFIFKKVEFVILPIIVSLVSLVVTSGIFGVFGWDITVISSNFVSLQLIITISIILHLIVRYNELSQTTNLSQKDLLLETIKSKAKPSFFAIITTIAGFGSLVLSNIKPVINLGYMMSIGVATSLAVSFILFPSFMMLFSKKETSSKRKEGKTLMESFAKIVANRSKTIYITAILIAIISVLGAKRLKVENSFINYFKSSTEIYKGMEVIDKKLGGTTPLDVIVTFKEEKKSVKSSQEGDDDFADFEDEFQEDENSNQYWFTPSKISVIKKVHAYLNSIKEIGNVQSFGTILEIGKILNNGKELGNFELAILYNELPEKFRKIILNPYINIEANQLRFATRVIDSNPNLRRDKLIKKINKDLQKILKNDDAEFRLSNLMILYNNMLQSLFKSQIETLGAVVLILFLMFLVLFKSFKVATIAIVTNIIPIGAIFAIMGYFDIPLDVMTITIASISIGIGVDDTIHYIERFKKEFQKDRDYIAAMRRSHNSIGYAMGYTSFAIILGFSILLASNFIPTIYFGALTVLVMLFALISALLLLPRLLITFKAFG